MTSTIKQNENVNGVMLSLLINIRSSASKGRRFTISFSNYKEVSWSKPSLYLTVTVNIIALLYVQINFTFLLIVAAFFTFLLILLITNSVHSESILVIPQVGIQCTTKYVHGKENKFIPWCTIEDVIINEVIHLNRVMYYLTVLVKDTEEVKLIPLFKYTKPRLVMLENIYSEIQSLLASKEEEDKKKGSGDTV